MSENYGWPEEDDMSCLACGEDVLDPGNEYYDGQEVKCSACGGINFVSCNRELRIYLWA